MPEAPSKAGTPNGKKSVSLTPMRSPTAMSSARSSSPYCAIRKAEPLGLSSSTVYLRAMLR